MGRLFLVVVFFATVQQNLVLMAKHSDQQLTKYRPLDLVTPQRLDNMAKYIYAKYRSWGVKSSWLAEIYIEQMRAGCNLRDKLSSKYCVSDFLKAFDNTLDSIKKDGFDTSKSTVTIGLDGNIIDGSHRTTACVLYGHEFLEAKPVDKIFQGGTVDQIRSNQRNVRGGLKEKYLDHMALEYCMLKKNTYIAIKFPECEGELPVDMDRLVAAYGTKVFDKKVLLTHQGFINCINLLYPDMPAQECAQRYGTANQTGALKVYLFQVKNDSQLHDFAQAAQKMMENNSCMLYVNGHHQDTVMLAQSFFNNNSVHFLNHAQPVTMLFFDQLLDEYRTFLKREHLNPDCFCICGDAVLAAYGIKDCNRLELIAHDDLYFALPFVNGGLLCNKDEIIFCPSNHFYYRGLKFEKLQPTEMSLVQQRLRVPQQTTAFSTHVKDTRKNERIDFLQAAIRGLMRMGTIF